MQNTGTNLGLCAALAGDDLRLSRHNEKESNKTLYDLQQIQASQCGG